MTAREIIQEAAEAGIELSANGDKLRVKFAGELPSGIKRRLEEHKQEILAALRQRQAVPPALFVVRSDTLEGELVVFRQHEGVKVPHQYKSCVAYTFEEACRLVETVTSPEALRAAHYVKKMFNGRVMNN